jgi:hypothetical protein
MAHRICLRGSLPSTHLLLGIGAVDILQLSCLPTRPPLQVLFETAAIPLRIWPRLLFGGFVLFFVEAEKLIIRLTRSSKGVAASVRAP